MKLQRVEREDLKPVFELNNLLSELLKHEHESEYFDIDDGEQAKKVLQAIQEKVAECPPLEFITIAYDCLYENDLLDLSKDTLELNPNITIVG